MDSNKSENDVEEPLISLQMPIDETDKTQMTNPSISDISNLSDSFISANSGICTDDMDVKLQLPDHTILDCSAVYDRIRVKKVSQRPLSTYSYENIDLFENFTSSPVSLTDDYLLIPKPPTAILNKDSIKEILNEDSSIKNSPRRATMATSFQMKGPSPNEILSKVLASKNKNMDNVKPDIKKLDFMHDLQKTLPNSSDKDSKLDFEPEDSNPFKLRKSTFSVNYNSKSTPKNMDNETNIQTNPFAQLRKTTSKFTQNEHEAVNKKEEISKNIQNDSDIKPLNSKPLVSFKKNDIFVDKDHKPSSIFTKDEPNNFIKDLKLNENPPLVPNKNNCKDSNKNDLSIKNDKSFNIFTQDMKSEISEAKTTKVLEDSSQIDKSNEVIGFPRNFHMKTIDNIAVTEDRAVVLENNSPTKETPVINNANTINSVDSNIKQFSPTTIARQTSINNNLTKNNLPSPKSKILQPNELKTPIPRPTSSYTINDKKDNSPIKNDKKPTVDSSKKPSKIEADTNTISPGIQHRSMTVSSYIKKPVVIDREHDKEQSTDKITKLNFSNIEDKPMRQPLSSARSISESSPTSKRALSSQRALDENTNVNPWKVALKQTDKPIVASKPDKKPEIIPNFMSEFLSKKKEVPANLLPNKIK